VDEAQQRAERFHDAVFTQQHTDYRTIAYEASCRDIVSQAALIDLDYRALVERVEAAGQWIEQSGAMCDDYWETPDGLDCSCGCRKIMTHLRGEA
jgi:hypothetical protein